MGRRSREIKSRFTAIVSVILIVGGLALGATIAVGHGRNSTTPTLVSGEIIEVGPRSAEPPASSTTVATGVAVKAPAAPTIPTGPAAAR